MGWVFKHRAGRWLGRRANTCTDSTLKSHFFCVRERNSEIHFFKVSEEKDPGKATEEESIWHNGSKRKDSEGQHFTGVRKTLMPAV